MTAFTTSSSWRLWARQILAVTRLELRKCLRGRRLIGLALLNLAPVAVVSLTHLSPQEDLARDPSAPSLLFAVLFAVFVLRASVFFTSATLSIQLLRSEMLEKTLHYYLLAPVRRGIVIAGKFLAVSITASLMCCLSVGACYLLLFAHLGDGMERFLLHGQGGPHLLAYLGITVLGCIGYSAVFILFGLLWRNPILPGLALFGWESVLFLLPPSLKLASVLFYLESLLPHRPPVGPLAILAAPPSAIASVAGLLVFASGILALAGWRARRTEISYSTD